MQSATVGRFQPWLLALVGLAIAGALFAGGMLVARATDDSEEAPPLPPALRQGSTGQAPGWSPYPQAASDGDLAGEASADDQVKVGVGVDQAISRPYFCGGVLPEVVSGSTIDLAAAGFEPRLLGEGFALRSLGVYGDGPCETKQPQRTGRPGPRLSWLHAASGYDVSVSQRVAQEGQPNTKQGLSASFTVDGYTFSVFVNAGYEVFPADDGVEPATNPEDDPAAQALLDEVIALLAPGLAPGCFATLETGGWEAFAALGIGDPRPAIPAGFTEEMVNVRTWVSGDPSCGGEVAEGYGAGFDASFSDGAGGGVYVSAYGVYPGEQPFAGSVDTWGASWSNGGYHFSVGAKTEQGEVGLDVITSIARAMDPGFDNACVYGARTISEDELAGLGFSAPAVPEGYTVVRSDLVVRELSGDCSGVEVESQGSQVSLSWSLEGTDGTAVEVNVNHYPGDTSPAGGFRGPGSIYWSDGNGTSYNVSGYSRDDGSVVAPDEVLEAIALSLDPSLDLSSLDDEPKPIPLPEPAARDADGASSSGSTGSAPTR